jgi:hypothetical protein
MVEEEAITKLLMNFEEAVEVKKVFEFQGTESLNLKVSICSRHRDKALKALIASFRARLVSFRARLASFKAFSYIIKLSMPRKTHQTPTS